MTLSNTPRAMRLHERYCQHAWRLRASSRLSCLWLNGRVGRRVGRCAPGPRGAAQSAPGACRLPRAEGSPHGEPGTRGWPSKSTRRAGSGVGLPGPGGAIRAAVLFLQIPRTGAGANAPGMFGDCPERGQSPQPWVPWLAKRWPTCAGRPTSTGTRQRERAV
jgi:hypothetical protein